MSSKGMLEADLTLEAPLGQDISGTLPTQYTEALAFIKRNLHRVQGNQGFNSLGLLEVPELALQELLVNALVHRDYFTSASIRILVFRDRIEIISPGHLPDSLSIDDIRQGKTNRRNPTLTEHAFKLLPHRGLGSGIPRALEEWPQIELINDVRGNQFTALVRRPNVGQDGVAEQVTPQVEAPVTDPVSDPVTDPVLRILQTLIECPLAPSEIQQRLALRHRPTFRANYLHPALAAGLIEPTLPDKPNSRLQQYRLTEKARRLLK